MSEMHNATIRYVLGLLLPALILLTAAGLRGQRPESWADSSAAPGPEPKTPLEAFRKGRVGGHFRSFMMATDNTGSLTDGYAWAVGGSLRYQSAACRGFRFGMSGAYHYNLGSSDFSRRDSATGAANRYEITLFDLEDPANKTDLDRFEEFWLRYEWKKARITLGQQSIQTPFINPQDGRMRPTYEAGIWVETGAGPRTRIEGGWLWGMAPRGTVRWYNVGESIGLYPRGLNPDGTASGYLKNLKSRGVGLIGATRRFGARLRLQLWDQWLENIVNTAFVQADYALPLRNGNQLLFGGQLTHQDALADGGNEHPEEAYIPKGAHSNVVSAQAGWQRGGWQALLAYTRVTADGRFLTPREWGREPFYTFMTRERIEGSGDSHSFTGRLRWETPGKRLRIETAYGRFYLPDVKNAALNKYTFPSFDQVNADLRYTFGGWLEGLRAQFFFVYKGRIGEVYGNDKYVINRVDMAHYNLVLNYLF